MSHKSTIIERLRGKKNRDLVLLNESGVIDPRLPPSPLEQLRKAWGVGKRASEVFDQNEADVLKGLRKAGKP